MKNDVVIYVHADHQDFDKWCDALRDALRHGGTTQYGFEYYRHVDEFEDLGRFDVHVHNTSQFMIFCLKYGLRGA